MGELEEARRAYRRAIVLEDTADDLDRTATGAAERLDALDRGLSDA